MKQKYCEEVMEDSKFREQETRLGVMVVIASESWVLIKKASILASSCLSTWNNLASTGRVCVKYDVWEFFENMSRKSYVYGAVHHLDS